MNRKIIIVLIGFILLFGLYHAAEYMIVFKNSPLGFLGFQLLFFVAARLIAKWQSLPGLAAWGLSGKKYFLKHLLLGMVMGLLLYGLTFMISILLGAEKITLLPEMDAIIGPLSLFIFGNFFSSVSEDILTRGYVYQHLNRKVSNWLLVIISATIYLLNHIYRLGDGVETYLYLFLLGVMFIIPLILTKRLWFTSGVHWAGNSFFYLTHELIKTDTNNTYLSPNYILALVIIFMIPFNYFLLRKFRLINVKAANSCRFPFPLK